MSDPTIDHDADWQQAAVAARKRKIIALAVVTTIMTALAVLPAMAGLGPFGVRIITADNVEVHVLNLSGGDLDIELPFASTVRVTAGTMETLGTLEGPARLRAITPEGDLFEELEFEATGPIFYNAGGGQCFAVFDISNLYGGGDDQQMSVVARLDEDTRIYAFEADTILLPRRTPPESARGSVHWLEPVGCGLLEPSEEHFLIGRSLLRLQERRQRYEEQLREAREQP
jgi:hypothetical protein